MKSRRRLIQITSLALLCLVVGDLVADSCDRPVPAQSRPMLSAGGAVPDDPCSDVCIADCFCCAANSMALDPWLLAAPAITVSTSGRDGARTTPGVSPVPDHIPLIFN